MTPSLFIQEAQKHSHAVTHREISFRIRNMCSFFFRAASAASALHLHCCPRHKSRTLKQDYKPSSTRPAFLAGRQCPSCCKESRQKTWHDRSLFVRPLAFHTLSTFGDCMKKDLTVQTWKRRARYCCIWSSTAICWPGPSK